VLSPGDDGFPPHVPLDMTVHILFGSSRFGSFDSYALIPPGVLSVEDDGFLLHVPLDDKQSLIVSGIQDFGESALLCTQRIKACALYLDRMSIDTLC
jgi:hypothetical protein